MIILSTEPRSKLLLPQRRLEWDQPSAHGYGIPNQTRFRLTARTDDGFIVWRGWFDDREDADEFLWALFTKTLQWTRALWGLPSPKWYPMYPGLRYDFATVTFLTSPINADSIYTRPIDWNNSNNSMECIGGGGNGYSGQGVAYGGGGGGGAAYSKVSNRTIGATANCWIGQHTQGSYFGIPGTDYASAMVIAAGGADSVQVWYGGAGGPASSGTGDIKYSGGYSQSSYYGASGGGGAAGPHGAGGAGGGSIDSYASSGGGGGGNGGGSDGQPGHQGAVGGNGGNNFSGVGGGVGGTGIAPPGTLGGGAAGGCGYGYGQAAAHGAAGGNGIEWDSSHGSGGGASGGGDGGDSTGIIGGYGYGGGFYGGGGGGGGAGTYSGSAGAGAQGIVVVIYTPQVKAGGFNMPMLGM